ncbi:hypothetical protein WJX84_002428 [Apatococcus fuscideae]|uniref:FACT complex subunit SSRP1 n=1 Tax=Apatococcus fuscideae TaxID=2026836 RepID=A0AAW1RZ45_9CHLO
MVASFPAVSINYPRGRFDIELYLNFMKLVGQNQDFRIQYDSLHRLFLLPRPNSSQTIVAISVDPPIRKGNTYYPFIICQFSNDEERTLELDISDEALKAKNDASSGRPTEKTMEGTLPDVFAKALRGLATAKLTKPGKLPDVRRQRLCRPCVFQGR